MSVCVFNTNITKMANFSLMDDDDYEGLFITQEPSSSNVVSLEDNEDYKTIKDPQYSDISDDETDCMERRLR